MKLMNLAAALFMTAALVARADEKDKPSSAEPKTRVFSDARIGLVFRADSSWTDLGHGTDSDSPETFQNSDSKLRLIVSKAVGVDRTAVREVALAVEAGLAKSVSEFKHESLEMNDTRDVATLRFSGKGNARTIHGLLVLKLQGSDAWVYMILGNDNNADRMQPTMDRALAGLGSMDFSAEAAKAVASRYVESVKKADADGYFACLNVNAMADEFMPNATKEERVKQIEKFETSVREGFKKVDPEKLKGSKFELGEMQVDGDRAMVKVTMTSPDGESEENVLVLSPTLDGWRVSDILVKDDKAGDTNLH